MSSDERHLSPAEAARRLGVTIKALRLYEKHGLVRPLRCANGWRSYGPAQIARLHQVLALKHLGLPLSRIAALLGGGADTLGAVLALQEQVLAADAQRIDRALALVRAARAQLAGGKTLSIDELTALARETTMNMKPSGEEMRTLMQPYIDKYFSEEDRAKLGGHTFDPAETQAEWDRLISEARAMLARNEDPASPAARDLLLHWTSMVEKFTGGMPDMEAKAREVWRDAMADPKASPKLLLNPEVFAFISRIKAGVEAGIIQPE